jgi:hypothetical protein
LVRSELEVDIEVMAKPGRATETILDTAKEIGAKWIVAGMKGTGHTLRRLLGSTAISLSRRTELPLIVVPEKATFRVPSAIALASDIADETNVHILDPLEELGLACESKLFIVRVISKGMDEAVERLVRPTRVKYYCKDLNPSFEFLNDEDVVHALHTFVQDHNVDIVAMMGHEYNLFDRIFARSEIKEMLFQTQVPLLILPGKVASTSLNEMNNSSEESKSVK